MNSYAYRTYAEIDLDKLQHNLRQVRALTEPSCQILFVLKADAYGHGTAMCARCSQDLVDWYGVATIDEAQSIRRAGVQKPVLLLGRLLDEDLAAAADSHITINACSLDYIRHVSNYLGQTGRRIDCHIKIDTGMNRTGLFARADRYEGAVAEAEAIFALPNVRVTVIYTHFSCGDSSKEEDIRFTEGQYRAFRAVTDALEERGCEVGLRHCVSTCPLLCHPEWQLDMVRVGMLGYGQSMNEEWTRRLDLHPVLRWCAKVISVLELGPDESVSYGRIYRTKGPARIAVFSAGYADGYNRSYSNRAKVILGGQPVPECGKVCMDFAMADVTEAGPVQVGDTAVLLGECEYGTITPDSLSGLTEYGVNGWTTCQISARVPRIYVSHGEVVETRLLFQ